MNFRSSFEKFEVYDQVNLDQHTLIMTPIRDFDGSIEFGTPILI